MAKRKSETFSAVDAAWLHMETPTNMAMITGVYTFDHPVDWNRFRDMVDRRMLCYDRFKMRAKEPLLGVGRPKWEFDPHFSLDAHVHRIALPSPGGLKELQDLVGDLMSTPLDFSKPLWQFHLVENLGEGCAIVYRLHHCIADGIALVQVLLSMTDCETNPAETETPAARQRVSTARGVGGMLRPAVKAVNRTVDTAESLLYEGIETVADPGRVLDAAALGYDGVKALGKLVLTFPDSKTLFRGNCGVPKRAAWTEPVSIADVKAVGKALGGTINDVLISCLAGGLGRYLREHDQPTKGLNIRAMVPVNLRKEGEADKLGNRFGLVILSLPVGIQDPVRRLRVLKKRMDDIKNTPEAVVAFGLLNGMGITPTMVEYLIMRFFTAKVSGVMTNVPGPREPLYFCGEQIKSVMFWVPTPGNLGLGTSIISYNGQAWVGVATDAGLVPDPEAITANFIDEFKAMQAHIRPEGVSARPAEEPEQAMVTISVSGDHPSNGRVRSNGHEPAAMCQALTKSGEPCRNHALPGQTTCARHTKTTETAG